MCTLSWCFAQGGSGYQLLFNRDEQLSRELAESPRYFEYGSEVMALMPVDPKGQGSWIAVNNRGLTLALLNFYQGHTPPGELRSRGQIVRRAAGLSCVDDIDKYLRASKLHYYPPFSLLVFDKHHPHAIQFQWNGEKLGVSAAMSPIISSSVDFERVFEARQALYQTSLGEAPSFDALLEFHASHHPKPSALSVCMHREDAETLSQTQVLVDEQYVKLNYLPVAPCSANAAAMRRYSFPLLSPG